MTGIVMNCFLRRYLSNLLYFGKMSAVAFFLTLMGIQEGQAAEAKGGTLYITKAVESSQVIFSPIPDLQKDQNNLVQSRKDITAIYPIGKSAQIPFQQSRWEVAPDGVAVVELDLPQQDGIMLPMVMTGLWEFRNGITQLHLTGLGMHGLKLAVDGVVTTDVGGLRMDAILSVSVRGAHHVERVIMKLLEVADVTPTLRVREAAAAFRKSRENEGTLRERQLLSEPTKWIGGIPTPTQFETTIKTTIDGEAFPPIDGEVFFHETEGSSIPSVTVTITCIGAMMAPGWNGWLASAEVSSQSKKVMPEETKEGRLRVVLPRGNPRTMNSWTRKSSDSNGVSMILVDEGIIDLRVVGDTLTGRITARGSSFDGSSTPSTFEATLLGKRQGSDFLKGVTNFIGARPFHGKWRDTGGTALTLQQEENNVRGGFSDGLDLQGVANGADLNFTWKTGQSKKGNGFLSAVNGILVGMIWKDQTVVAPIVAIQDLTEEQSKKIMTPKTDEEALELKMLGYDLQSAGKNREATIALMEVVNYYSSQAQSAQDNPAAYTNYLLYQVLPLISLMETASEAGEYPALVKALSMAVRVQKELGRESLVPRQFQEQARKFIAEMEDLAESMNKLSDGYDTSFRLLDASGVGLGFDEKDSNGFVIFSVAPDMPAGRAGIVVGDILTAIDGLPVADLSLEEGSQRLQGEDGSKVSITVLRRGNKVHLNLLREPLVVLPEGQKGTVKEAISNLQSLSLQQVQQLRGGAESIKLRLKNMEDQRLGYSGAHTDLQVLLDLLERNQEKLQDDRAKVLSLALQALSPWHTAQDIFQQFTALIDESTRNRGLDDAWTQRMKKIDAEADAYERSSAPDISKEILKLTKNVYVHYANVETKSSDRARIVRLALDGGAKSPNSDRLADILASLAGRMDHWRSKLVTDVAKIESQKYEEGEKFYFDLVEVLADLNLPHEALRASESARARAFQDLLAAGKPVFVGTGKDKASVTLSSLAISPSLDVASLLREVKELKSTVIEYMTTQKEIFIWVISPDGNVQMLRHPINVSDLSKSINDLIALLEPGYSREELQTRERQMDHIQKDIYAQLVDPIPHHLLPKDPASPVTIIPYKELFKVPFGILKDSNGTFFIKKHALAFAPAISVLRYIRQNQAAVATRDKTTLLAVVNPKPLPQSGLATLDTTENAFPALAEFYRGLGRRDQLIGREASKANLHERLRTNQYSSIYFGTHGVINDKDVFGSYIALANLEEGGTEDGKLTITDLLGFDLRSNLAILAACRTGRGSVSADGVNGLSRAFVLGGASTLLTTLWQVAQGPSFDQILSFHHHWLTEGMSKANALRSVQIEAMDRYPGQPDLWGGFQLYGGWE